MHWLWEKQDAERQREERRGKLWTRFPARIERKNAKTGKKMLFDVHVRGYFFHPGGGKLQFDATEITVDGAEWMNIRSFYAGEIKVLSDYAIKVEYPKLIGAKHA